MISEAFFLIKNYGKIQSKDQKLLLLYANAYANDAQ